MYRITLRTNIKNMKLSQTAIRKINDDNKEKALTTRLKLALALKVTERWIDKSIKENNYNGPLTKGAALKVIQEQTGLSFDQILAGETVKSVK